MISKPELDEKTLELSEQMRNWDKHNRPSRADHYADDVAVMEDALRATRQENSEMARMLAEPSENQELKKRIAELEQQLARVTTAYENYMAEMKSNEKLWQDSFQRDRERIAELKKLLLKGIQTSVNQMWIDSVRAALAKEPSGAK